MLAGLLIRIVSLQFLHGFTVSASADCTGLPPDKTHLTTQQPSPFPLKPGKTLIVKCADEDLVLHGSLSLTCLTGTTFHNQTDPFCQPAKKHSVALIVGVVVATLAVVGLVLGGIYLYFKSGFTSSE